jgi:OPA family glycerol-3-phosphate transporter-like MFS transporter
LSQQADNRAKLTLLALFVGYVGIYLCRKNLAATFPSLERQFNVSHAQLGRIASVGTALYAVGKAFGGPIVDRFGGRAGFLTALYGVAIFGAFSSASSGLTLLTGMYALNRAFAAMGWPAAMKLVPTWFPARHASIVGTLSVSYALGGVAATTLASAVSAAGGEWRAILLVPALLMGLIAIGCTVSVSDGPFVAPPAPGLSVTKRNLRMLICNPRFLVVCGLSLSLTLFRESFGTWSVDFLVSISGTKSIAEATLKSGAFDLAGAVAIYLTGITYDRTPERARPWLISAALALLAIVLAALPAMDSHHPGRVALLMCCAGLLVYGPYSLLAGVFAIECGGTAAAASASAFIDCVGYLGGILAGEALGRVLDYGGYRTGFECLAAIAAGSAVLALFLSSSAQHRTP